MYRKPHAKPIRTQLGVTLMEMMGVLLVIALLYAGGSYALNLLSGNGSVTDDVKNIQILIANIKAGKDISGYGTGDLLPGLVADGSVPKTMTVTGNQLSNAFTGAVTVTGNGLTYTVTTANVAKSDCIKEAQQISKVATSTSVNGGSTVSGPMTKAQATSGCTADTNTLSFTNS